MKSRELTPHQQNYVTELKAWVIDTFREYQTLIDFIQAFNDHFTHYQHDFYKKMDLNEIRSGIISCSIAILIVGIWWDDQEASDPEFLIDLEESGYIKKHEHHVVLALPLIALAADSNFNILLSRPRDKRVFEIIDYVHTEDPKKIHKNGLQITPDKRVPVRYNRITGTNGFAKNRFEVFKYQPHPSAQVEASSSPSTRSTPASQPQ